MNITLLAQPAVKFPESDHRISLAKHHEQNPTGACTPMQDRKVQDAPASSNSPMEQLIEGVRFQRESLLPPVPWEIELALNAVMEQTPTAETGLDVLA